jgi:hypothetical protein
MNDNEKDRTTGIKERQQYDRQREPSVFES